MKAKTMRRALLMSVISLMLCVSMLVGTTFAWFTDEVTSANNIIKSGNLDVELYYQVEGQSDWTKVTEKTNIFMENALWEPGHTEVVKLKVVNEGTLALKYQLGVNVASETGSVNVNGAEFKLSDHIKFGVVEGAQTYTREQAVAAVDATATALNVAYNNSAELLPKTEANADNEDIVTMVVYMPTSVDNVANHAKDAAVPTINLGVNLFATQLQNESDSFGSDYDKGTAWTGGIDVDWYFADPDAKEFVLTSAEELAGLAALVNEGVAAPVTTFAAEAPALVKDNFKGKTIKLGANIDLRDASWTPIGTNPSPFLGNFDGQGHTISNLNVSNSGWAGLIGHAGLGVGSDIKNVKINGATIRSNRMAGAVVGQLYGSIDNCHVKNATIMVIPNAVGDSYDNGDKVGGIVGWLGDNGDNRVLSNCSAENVEVGAYRDVGGIAGYVASSTAVKGNSVKAVTITVDQTTNYYGDKDPNAGKIYGRTGGAIVEDTNSFDEASTVNATYSKNGLTLKSDGVDVRLYLVPASYEDTTVAVPEGVTTIGGYAFAYNSNVETIKLPSSVKTLNDRAFRDTSASTVELNEGLTNISYQAFRNASNVKSVKIPSTVKTISKEAFQNSGVKELVIPATVTTIEYGGLRDMKELETVIIEGNVDIPLYAFRACTKLKTVILKGDDVTFGGGSRGMIFTNKENGDGSAITVYVANETVKERLLAADTAAKDYGGYTIIVGFPINTQDALTDALSAASTGETVLLAGDFKATERITVPEGVTLDGNGHTITFEGASYHFVNLSNGSVVKNVTLNNYRVKAPATASSTFTLEDVTINFNYGNCTGLDISGDGSGTAILKGVVVNGTTDEAHLNPATQSQAGYSPYGDVLIGGNWSLEATDCQFGSLHGWNTRNGSYVSLNNVTYKVFRMHYWSNRTLYINGVETAWSESGAIPVAHDVGGCWSVQPAFK